MGTDRGRIFSIHGGGQPCRLLSGQPEKRLKYRRYPRLKTDKSNDLIDELISRAVNPISAICSRARVLMTVGEPAS